MRACHPGELMRAIEVGAVDERGVRVWARWPSGEPLRLRLAVNGYQPVTAELLCRMEDDWTGAVRVALPRPAAAARFTLAGGGVERHGYLAPEEGQPARLTLGLGSCHQPFVVRDGEIVTSEVAAGIYPAFHADLQRADANVLLLAGDQIYADGLRGLRVREDAADPLAAYRRVYRRFFNEPGMRALRESLPTVMMWDDHDIVDNWGSEQDKAGDDARFAAAAKAYREYQHGRNPENGAGPPFPWTLLWGTAAVVALDTRGARDAERHTLLGKEQWRWLQDRLATLDRAVTTLLVVSSVPVAHVARWFTLAAESLPDRVTGSVRDRWNSAAFIASRDALLDLLTRWQVDGARRQVVLLSGDVHCASAFTIRDRRGQGVVRQLTSSALTTPLMHKQMLMNRLVVRLPNLFEPRWCFEREALSVTNNAAILRLEPLPGGGHRIVALVRAWDPTHGRLRTAARLVWSPEDASSA